MTSAIKVSQIPNEFRRPFYASVNGNKLMTATGSVRRFATHESAEKAAKEEAAKVSDH